VLTICNVVGSTASREADYVLYTHAGPEIGVASTKAFTAQLAVLYLLTIGFGMRRGTLSQADADKFTTHLLSLSEPLKGTLLASAYIRSIAEILAMAKGFLYLGRGISYPIALEGALKLKEISYIPAEGYPAGEMKHGPIALIDEQTPVVVIAPEDDLLEKILSNVEEVKARGAGSLPSLISPRPLPIRQTPSSLSLMFTRH
jgi:glucosamine--fructose-6-phosphate aminotransferase (isomerizing)